jgi:hypothetical protein
MISGCEKYFDKVEDKFRGMEDKEDSTMKKTNICCTALTASCLSCSVGKSVEEYCLDGNGKNKGVKGCEKICCRALNADCNSCAVGKSVEEYCKDIKN